MDNQPEAPSGGSKKSLPLYVPGLILIVWAVAKIPDMSNLFAQTFRENAETPRGEFYAKLAVDLVIGFGGVAFIVAHFVRRKRRG